MMTADPIASILDQLAAHHERISQLESREDEHYTALGGRLIEVTDLIGLVGQTVREHSLALVELAGAGPADPDSSGYRPGPTPAWWKLPEEERREQTARLRAWVEQIYRPGYGHLAAALGPCWDAHDLCLFGLDILAELWSVLYLRPERNPGLLSAQAEYQARLLPTLAEQLAVETARCGHSRQPGRVAGGPWGAR
jgi:hypothetical protein